ncbi:MAG: phosphodiester glycosidase family protein [Leptolyngbyaceae cyanobacterium]
MQNAQSKRWISLVLGLSITSVALGSLLNPRLVAIAWSAHTAKAPPRMAPPMAQLPVPTQGDSITVGSITLPIPWQRQGDRIGVADIPLMTHLGIELQDSTTAEQQPVLWFSDTAVPLPTWFSHGYRYLDLTAWASQRGWSLIPTGNRLAIQAPTGTVTAGRRSSQAGGDRLVLEVNRPILWTLEETATTFTLTLQATAASTFEPSALVGNQGSEFNSLQIITGNGQLQLRGTFDETSRPRVWSLSSPNRIVVDVNQRDVVPREIRWAPDVLWKQDYLSVGDRSFPVHQLWLNLNDRTSLEPIWGNPAQLPGITPLKTMAADAQAYFAINAGFFNRNNQLPLGAIRKDDQWISGPILGRGAIAWNAQRQFLLSRLALTHTLTTAQGATLVVNDINSGFVQAGIGLYTAAWGSTYTPITDGEMLITVNQNRVVQQTPGSVAGIGAHVIPREGYLLALRSFNSAAQALPVGTSLTLTPDLRPAAFSNYPFAVGGGPILVQNGQINANAQAEGFSDAFAAQAAPRSAIATTPDGNLILVAIHCSPGGRGPTLKEAAQIMQQLGAQNALNLDGGTSSSLYLGGTIINRHGSTVGRVHNGLGGFLAP